MARALQDIITELNAVYDPQRQSYGQQIQGLDPQLQAEQSGLNQQKQDSFQQITDQANRRGIFYSGIPIQEEQKYTASSYLPAIAGLHSKYDAQKFNLQDAIAKITSDQYNQAYKVRQDELDSEEKQREFDRQLAAQAAAAKAAASAAGSGGAGFSFGSGARPNQLPAGSRATASNPGGDAGTIFSLIQNLRQQPGGVQKYSWGALANEFKNRGIDVSHGSPADLALNAYFQQAGLATNSAAAVPVINRAIGR